jgi:hypothetical protein
MERYERLRRQAEQAERSRIAGRVHQSRDGHAPRFESREQQLEYEMILREYFSLLEQAKASLG